MPISDDIFRILVLLVLAVAAFLGSFWLPRRVKEFIAVVIIILYLVVVLWPARE